MNEVTTAETIAWFEKRKTGITTSGANAMYDKAIAALRAQAEAGKNDPLTLDELRQMVGEPVCIYNAYNGFYTWRVVDTISKKAIMFTDGEARLLNCYGNGWLAYRRRPEEETANA